MSEKIDFLIVGGGLAGTTLHLELRSRGLSSILLDETDDNLSSRIAAGIVNPITGKYFSLSWRSDEFFPDLEIHYRQLEDIFEKRFFHSMPIIRLLSGPGEENTWLIKAGKESYKEYFSPLDKDLSIFPDAHALLEIKRGGYLDTVTFLDSIHASLLEKKELRKMQFDHALLKLDAKSYLDIAFNSLVFCEGYKGLNNPLFSFLPISPNKGELLEIESGEIPEDMILIGSVFVLPLGNKRFKVGATYDHFDLSHRTTSEKRLELEKRFLRTMNVNYKVIDHWYGIRPAVRDRRPLLGRHPKYEDVYIFNGLGSKGASMAPLLSLEIADYMISGGTLHPEADIQRFY